MNFKTISLILFLGSLFAFVGCSSSDDEQLSSEKQIVSFAIDEAGGVINKEAHTIEVNLPFDTNVKTLIPSIQISDKARINPSDGVAADFTTPVIYTVTAEDGSKQGYTVTVKTSPFEPEITQINRTKFLVGQNIGVSGSFSPEENNTMSLKNSAGKLILLTDLRQGSASLSGTIPATLTELGEYTLVVNSYVGTSHEGSVEYKESKITIVDAESVAPKILTLSPTSTIARLDNEIHLTTENRLSLDGRDHANVYYSLNGGEPKRINNLSPGQNADDFYIDLTYLGLGIFTIYLERDGYQSNKVDVEVKDNPHPTPTITSISNYNPLEGEEITIKGTGFLKISNIDTYIKIDKVTDPGYGYPVGKLTDITVVDDNTIKCKLPFVDKSESGQFPEEKAGEIKIWVVANGNGAYHYTSITVKKK